MRPAVKLRSLTTEEEAEIRRLAASRKEPHRLVQRAQVIAAMLDDPTLHASHAGLRAGFRGAQSGINWVKRFNEEGLAGLEDKPKAGRPPTHDQKVRSELINLASRSRRPWDTPSNCGPWNGCRPLSKSAKASIYPIRPSGSGSKPKGSNGSARRVGSTKRRNMIRSSWKKGGHHNSLHGPTAAYASNLPG